MAENSISGVLSQHIDTRYHFVCENIEDGFTKIIFDKSNYNIADVFKHANEFSGRQYISNL
jgi:hypothetical protein